MKPLVPAVKFSHELNPQQLEVVENAEGPCLVLAGAGSGKTKVLVYRLAYLLKQGVSAAEILLATFSNRASRHMIQRAEMLLGLNLKSLWAGTFHHIANIILRREAEKAGYKNNFTIIDREDAKDLIQDVLEELGILKSDKLFPKKDIILNIWSLARNSRKNLEEIIAGRYSYLEEFGPSIKKALHLFQKRKKEANLMDFDDLLVFWLALMENKSLRDKYAQTFRYILVDEYQDTNRIQFEILKKISSYWHNILVVGDDAQSIYSFRAAEIRNILDFPRHFSPGKIFKLEINYRSTPQILAVANASINQNKNQFPKTLKAERKEGPLPLIITARDIYQQAEFICQKVKQLCQEGLDLSQMAVLFRSRYNALELEVELMKQNIPYIVRGGLRFFEQAHIKDILSFLKIVVNPQDELSFKRALCLEKGIGRKGAQRIWKYLVKDNYSKEKIEKLLPKNQKEGFRKFWEIFAYLKTNPSPSDAISWLIEKYRDYCYFNFDNPSERILDLEELSRLAHNFANLEEFLAELSSYEDFKGERNRPAQDSSQSLVLSTIHQAKGLEWNTVFILSLNEYDFPHPKSIEEDNLEEERRLFYVAITRTKYRLYLLYFQRRYSSQEGFVLCRPSVFLTELPSHILETATLNNNQDIYY